MRLMAMLTLSTYWLLLCGQTPAQCSELLLQDNAELCSSPSSGQGGIAQAGGPTVVPPILPEIVRVTPSVLQSLASSEPPIPYPATARGSGKVLLKVVISKSGAVQEIHVVQGTPDFDQAALNGVKSWKYRPFLLNGEPHQIQSTISVYFAGSGTAGVRPPR
jgi:protein TonB